MYPFNFQHQNILDLCHSFPKLVCQIGCAGTDIHDTSIDIAARYRQLFTKYEECHSLLNSKDNFDANKKTEFCKCLDIAIGLLWCFGYVFEEVKMLFI